MKQLQSLVSGAVGAASLTLVHEVARRLIPHAPRVDVIGMRAIAKSMRAADQDPPPRDALYWLALGGDLVSNALYYSLVSAGKKPDVWRRGALLGAIAGLGAALLPEPLGLGRQPNQQTPTTQLLTVAWYTLGGLASAATAQALQDSDLRERVTEVVQQFEIGA